MEISWKLRDLRKAILATFLLVILANIFFEITGFYEIFEASERKSLLTLLIFILQEAFFIFPLVFFIFQKYPVTKEMLGFRAIGILKTIGFVIRAYLYVLIIDFLFVVFLGDKSVPGFEEQQNYFDLFGGMKTPLDAGIAIFVLIILAPIVEELVFRGVILQTLASHFGNFRGNVLTALIFAAIHFQFESFVLLLILGFILNWLFLRTKSLYPTIAFHVFNNSAAFLVQWLVFAGKIHIENLAYLSP